MTRLADCVIDEMMMEAKDFENQWIYALDWDCYQKTTAGLLLHRKMRNASSKIRKDVKSRIKRKITRNPRGQFEYWTTN